MARKVNAELNLTPFIGLFALLVCMLLMTAVWNQLAVLSTDTSSTTASDSESPQEPKVQLSVTILQNHLELAEDSEGIKIAHGAQGEINRDRLIEFLKNWKEKYPERSDVILNTENSVSYRQLISVFDTLVGNGWHDVGVSTQ